MKKISILFLATLFMASCSTKISLVKRKYNKGFFVSVNHNTKNKSQHHDIASNTSNKESISKKPTRFNESPTQIMLNEASYQQPNGKEEHSVTSIKNINHTRKSTNYESVNKSTLTESFTNALTKSSSKKQFFGKGSQKEKADSGIDKLILVILSLFPFICLIAVYLKDGKSITLNFWIDLLLHLTVIGEVIYALLVVLDVFSAA